MLGLILERLLFFLPLEDPLGAHYEYSVGALKIRCRRPADQDLNDANIHNPVSILTETQAQPA